MTLKWHGYAAFTLAIVFGASTANAQKMYLGGGGGILRTNLDGTDAEVIVGGVASDVRIALDIAAGKIYWTEQQTDAIRRANLDGTQIENLITTGLARPWGIALDRVRGKMYWASFDSRSIRRANLDGTGVEDVLSTGTFPPTAIKLDSEAGKVYFALAFAGIRRANLDGTDVENVSVHVPLTVFSFTLDLNNDQVYYTMADIFFGESPGRIQRSNLDGSGIEDLVDESASIWRPEGIALDVPTRKMYWSDTQAGGVWRADLDGSDIELLISDIRVADIALQLPGDPIPAVSVWGLVVIALMLLTVARVLSLRRLRSLEGR